jgi:hypothetical protein
MLRDWIGGVDRIRLAQLLALRICRTVEGVDRASRCEEDHPDHDEQRRGKSRDREQDVEPCCGVMRLSMCGWASSPAAV